MLRQDAEKYLNAAMAVGEATLRYGGEVSRVEDSIRRICTSYGFVRTDVFCITSSIITTACFTQDDEEQSSPQNCTQTRRISHTENDFDKLGQVNSLSRSICSSYRNPDEVLARLEEIQCMKERSLPVQMLIYAAVPASFTVFFGGNVADLLISGLTGAILLCLRRRLREAYFNGLFIALVCSLAGGFLANVMSLGIQDAHAALISIGNVMVFIPGVKFTNSIRDLLTGETITGLICLAESLLLSAVVALGFAASALVL